jgi:polar amino acid transport system substrate-binding protein
MLLKQLSILVFIYMAITTKAYSEETWKIASLNWPPYSGPELAHQGSSIKILKELLKKNNITLIVEFLPWQRAKYLVQTDPEYLAIFPAWPEDVFDNALLSPAIDWSEIGILKRTQQALNFDSIDELFKNHAIGVVSTYIYPKVFVDAIKKYPNQIEQAPNEFSLLMKLSSDRSSAAITDPKVMLHLANKEGITDLEALFIMKKELVMAFKDSEENRNRLKILTQLLMKSDINKK